MNVDFNTPYRSVSQRGLSSVMELCSPISFTDPLSSFVSDNEFDSGNTNDRMSGTGVNHHNSNNYHSLYPSADRNHPLRDDSDRYIAPRANQDISLSNYLLTSKENCNPLQMFSPRMENSLSATPSRSLPRSKWQFISSASPSQVHSFTASRSKSTRHPFLTHPTRSGVPGRSTSPLLLTPNRELALDQGNNVNCNEDVIMINEAPLSSPLLAVQECEPIHKLNSPNNLQTEEEESEQEEEEEQEYSELERVPSPEVEMKYTTQHDNSNDNDNMNGMKTTSHSIRENDKSDNELYYLQERRKRQKSEAAATSEDNNNLNKTEREASPLPHPPMEPSSFATPPPVFPSLPHLPHSPTSHSSSPHKESSLFASFKVEKRLFSATPSHPRHTSSQQFTCTNANRLSSVFRKLHLDTDSNNKSYVNNRLGSNRNINHSSMSAAEAGSLSQPRSSALYEESNSPENSYSASQPSPRQKISMLHRHSSSSTHGELHCGNCMSHSLPPEEPGFLSMTDIEPYTSKLARTLFSESPQVSVLGLHHHVPDLAFSSSCSSGNCTTNIEKKNMRRNMSNSVMHYNSCGRCESEHSSVDPSLSAVFEANKARNFKSTSFRIIAQTPERILDAADLIDDFYLNLIDWSSASDVLAVALQSVVYLWDATTGNITPLPTNKVPSSSTNNNNNNNNNNNTSESNSDRLVCGLQWASDGTSLAIGLQDGTVEIWNVPTQQVIHSWRQHTGRVGTLSWMGNFQSSNNNCNSGYSVSGDGCLLASGSKDSTIHIHDLRDAASRHRPNVGILHSHEQEVCGLKWSPANVYLASGGNDNQLLIWDKRRFSCNERLSTLTPFIRNNYSGGNSRSESYSSCWESSTVPVWYLNEHKAAVKALAWNPTCPSLLVSGGGTEDKMLRFWNIHHGQCIRSANTHSQVCGVLWNQSGNELVSSHGYSLNQLIIWKYPSLRQVAQLHGHTSRVLHLCLSKDGQTVVSAAGDETIRFWRCFPPQPTTSSSTVISESSKLTKEGRRGGSTSRECSESLHDTQLSSHSLFEESPSSSLYSPSSSLFAHHTIAIKGHHTHFPIAMHHRHTKSSNSNISGESISPSPFMFSRDRARYLGSVTHHPRPSRHSRQVNESPYKPTPDKSQTTSINDKGECASKSPEVLLLSSSSESEELFYNGSLPLLSIPGLDKHSTTLTTTVVDTTTHMSKMNLSRPPPLSLELECASASNDDHNDNDNDNAASLFVNTPPRNTAHLPSPSMATISKATEIFCDELMCEQIALR